MNARRLDRAARRLNRSLMPNVLAAPRKKASASNGLNATPRARSLIGGVPIEVCDPATGRVRVIRMFQRRAGGNFAKHAARYAGIVKDGPPDLSTRRPFE